MAATAIVAPTKESLTNRALVMLGEAPVNTVGEDSVAAIIASTFYETAFEEFLGSTGWRFAMRSVSPTFHYLEHQLEDSGWSIWAPTTAYIIGDRRHYTDIGTGIIHYRICISPHTSPTPEPGEEPTALYWILYWADFMSFDSGLSPQPIKPFDESYAWEYKLPDDFLSLYDVDPPAQHEIVAASKTIGGGLVERYLWSRVEINMIHYSAKVGESLMPPHAQEVFVYKLAHLIAIPVSGNRARSEYFYELYMKALRRAQAIEARQRPNSNVVRNGTLVSHWDEV